MICISVTPESRRLAKADILNASRQGDLIELCLDKLIKQPDIGEMIAGFDKPILISCRRQQDGGQWDGSEEDRLQLLRSAIVASPAYIELELGIASKVPRFGSVKRVISINSPEQPLTRIDSLFDQAAQAQADVVKFTWPTRTLDEAWPLLAAVSQKRELPVVGIGLGESGITFSLLGRKFGSPWIYAALERRLEAYPGQPTVWDLQDSYAWRDIQRSTRFVGVVGSGEREVASIRVMNEAFRKLNADYRCLPLKVDKLKNVDKMLGTLKIRGLIVSPGDIQSIFPLIEHPHRTVAETGFADLLLRREDGWHGHNTVRKAVVNAIRAAGKDFSRRRVLVIGSSGLTDSLMPLLVEADAAISVAHPDDKIAKKMAAEFGAVHVSWSAMYDTVAEYLFLTDPAIDIGQQGSRQLNPSILREHMTVIDVSRFPGESPLLDEARARGCVVIEPTEIYIQQLSMQFRAITGKDLPVEAFRDGLAN